MRVRTILACLASSAWVLPAHAVSEAACIWLKISPSTRATGMGNTFSPLSDDPFNAWFAPGSEVLRPEGSPWLDLGLTGYPGGISWLPGFNLDGISLDNQALSLRLDPQQAQGQGAPSAFTLLQPWQLSLSYLHIQLEEGSQTVTDESGNILGIVSPVEQAHALRLGLGRRHERWALGLGLGLDHVVSDLASGIRVGETAVDVGRSTSVDVGVNLQAKPLPRQWLNPADHAEGYLDWSLGLQYSKLFLGSHISYADDAPADPLPFHDRLALASRWRLALPPAGGLPELPVLEAHVALERSVDLVSSRRNWQVVGIRDNQPGGHWDDPDDPEDDISWDKHYYAFDERLLAGSSERVERSSGWELGLLGTFFLRQGNYLAQAGHVSEQTRGWGVRSAGLVNWMLRSWPGLSERPVRRILQRLDIQYDRASISARTLSDIGDWTSPLDHTKYQELSLRWNF